MRILDVRRCQASTGLADLDSQLMVVFFHSLPGTQRQKLLKRGAVLDQVLDQFDTRTYHYVVTRLRRASEGRYRPS